MLALISSFESGNNNSYYIGIKGDNAHGKGQLSKGIHSSINNLSCESSYMDNLSCESSVLGSVRGKTKTNKLSSWPVLS